MTVSILACIHTEKDTHCSVVSCSAIVGLNRFLNMQYIISAYNGSRRAYSYQSRAYLVYISIELLHIYLAISEQVATQ